MDLGEMRWGGMNRIDLAQDMDHLRVLVDTVRSSRVPQSAEKLLSSCTTTSV
jgi:hypothetical protein